MESKEQSVKNQIISDLRAGRMRRQLVGPILGDGGYRLARRELDHIFEWMVANPDEWHVVETPDDRRFVFVVVFGTSPFHPEEWDNYEDYKHVMRQMFDDYGTEDFLTHRSTTAESYRIRKNLAAIGNPIKLYDYVTFDFNGVRTLGMVIDGGILNEIYTVKILSGGSCGLHSTVKNAHKIEPEEAIKELSRQKGEWKNKKREEALRKKYGNIVRGSYLKSGISLYIVESVDMIEEKATAIRLLYSFIKQPAGEKCILPLENGFKLITAEEAAEIILKEYSNE